MHSHLRDVGKTRLGGSKAPEASLLRKATVEACKTLAKMVSTLWTTTINFCFTTKMSAYKAVKPDGDTKTPLESAICLILPSKRAVLALVNVCNVIPALKNKIKSKFTVIPLLELETCRQTLIGDAPSVIVNRVWLAPDEVDMVDVPITL